MANIKDVMIEAKVPWDWTSQLSGDEARVFVAWFMNPLSGVKLEQQVATPAARGIKVTIYGEEAMNIEALRSIVRTFTKIGTIELAKYRDVENNTNWFQIEKS